MAIEKNMYSGKTCSVPNDYRGCPIYTKCSRKKECLILEWNSDECFILIRNWVWFVLFVKQHQQMNMKLFSMITKKRYLVQMHIKEMNRYLQSTLTV